MRWKKITIVGMGLLGGSLGLVARKKRLAGEVAAYVRRPQSIKECERAGAADYATTDLLAAVSNADLVILCTPLAQMESLVKQMLPALKRGAIVTDVGSVKGSVVKDVEAMIAKTGAHFVGSHPMAGGEMQGVLAARADLFECAVCVVTPTKKSNRSAVGKVQKLWKSVGGRVINLTPEIHDSLVSRSSHLPHIVAAALASAILDPKHPKQIATLCATGFCDTTRIASGSPEMWRDILLANREALRLTLDEFVRELQQVQALLRKKRKNAGKIQKFFEQAKSRRDKWSAQCVSPSEE